MNWEETYQKGGAFWNKGKPSPPLKQYLERNAVRGRTFVPGCGHGHEVALAGLHWLLNRCYEQELPVSRQFDISVTWRASVSAPRPAARR